MFVLDKTLQRDTQEICDLSLCKVLLLKDKNYPWLILVPKINGLVDFHDIPAEQSETLMAEIKQVSELLKSEFEPTKINVGALGNMVRQLHIHVIARFEGDAAWPGPVWGATPSQPYADKELQNLTQRLKNHLI